MAAPRSPCRPLAARRSDRRWRGAAGSGDTRTAGGSVGGTRGRTQGLRCGPRLPSPPSLPAHDDIGVVLQALIQLLVTHAWRKRQWGVSGVPGSGVRGAGQPPPTPAPASMGLEAQFSPEPVPLRFEGSQRGEGDPETSAQPWARRQPPAFHRPQELHGRAWILTSLAADLIVAVASCVQPSWVAPLIPGDLDRVFLEPSDKALHQAKLDEPPGYEEGRDWDHDTEALKHPSSLHSLLVPPCHTTASVSPLTDAGVGYSLLAPPHLPPPSLVSLLPLGTEQEGAGSDLSSTLWSCRV